MKLGPKRDDGWGGWSRPVLVEGVTYHVRVQRGNPVRIPFKPRGENRGFIWNGTVVDADGRYVWSGHVAGSIGARGLLRAAGVIQ